MDTKQIINELKHLPKFIGVFPRDLLPTRVKYPSCLIANTDPSSAPGEHWVAIILNRDRSGEYFDSYGLPPMHDEIIHFMNRTCPKGWTHNPITLQCIECVTCGDYCVYYLKLRSSGYS